MPELLPLFEARHDPSGFAGMDMHGAYNCILCDAVATVLDIEFFCDQHWLYCHVCGTGYVKTLDAAWCPKCHAHQFHTTKKETAK